MSRAQRTALSAAALAAAGLVGQVAHAGTFDERGLFEPAEEAVFLEPFNEPVRFVDEEDALACQVEGFERVVDPALALEGDGFLRVETLQDCAEQFVVDVPEGQGAYSASFWIRHGSANARLVVDYPEESELVDVAARLAPTGRATSDGWIELASNAVPVDTGEGPIVYLRFTDFASTEGVDVDALEVFASGAFRELPECEGYADTICGEDAVCISGRCRLGDPNVPPLPSDELRDGVVDALGNKIKLFFGGRKTRLVDMPVALETVEAMRSAKTAWQFWSGWALAVRQLHDWHTSARGPINQVQPRGRLNVCFIEGDADLSQHVLPKDPLYADILVSHTGGADNAGLRRGDRLVAVDGLHPIAWARNLIGVNWGYHVACDDTSFADFAEGLGGYGLILQYAKSFSVIRCDTATDTCSDVVETIEVKELSANGGGADVYCDNRPVYHLGPTSPPDNHQTRYTLFRGRIEGTTDEEEIHGMVWDTLYGGGDPNGYVNGQIRDAVADWKASARGVILDHRAGNGGTIDAPEYLTQLVRPQQVYAFLPPGILSAGFNGPETVGESLSLANYLEGLDPQPYTIGAPDHDPQLPVALIIHRDGSASDYLPQGMKGAPKTKLFGPGPTAGAFSTFVNFSYWGGLSFQLASGDTLTVSGESLIGRGVVPDFIVQQKQSDLVNGIDTIHEAALAWVRQELKP